MGTPRAVEEQDKLATEMMENVQQDPETPPSETPTADTPPVDTPQVETPPAVPQASDETWESRYRVLQGKYDREVPTLYNQLADFKIMVADLNSRLSQQERTMQERIPAPTKEVPPEVAYVKNEIPELDVALRYTLSQMFEQEIKPYIDQRTGDLTGKITSIETKTAKSSAERYEDALSEKIPNWRVINKDPGFEQWLSEKDRYTGIPRLDLLRDAHNSFDSKRVAVFFTDYLESKGAPPAKGGKDITKFTSPPKGSSSTPAPTEEIRSFTQSEIKDFYNKVARGDFKGREKESQEIEKQIDRAMMAGKVT